MKIIALLAASLMATTALTTAAHAADASAAEDTHGHALFKGNREQFVAALRDSLQKDSRGHHVLDAQQCQREKTGCVTPAELLHSLVAFHPDIGFKETESDLAKLPEFYEKLTANTYVGELDSAREIQAGNAWKIDVSGGFKRQPHKGEIVYFYGNTAVAFGDCWNTVMKPTLAPVTETALPCGIINAHTNRGARLDVAIMVPKDEEFVLDKQNCLAHQLANESVMSPGLPGQCQQAVCDFGDAERQLNLKSVLYGKAEQLAEGDQRIRVPYGYTVVLCYTEADGTRHRNQVIVRESFVHGQAWVRRTDADHPGDPGVKWHPWPS